MKKKPKTKAGKKKKIGKIMGEFKKGSLKSGSKKGPPVTKKAQAVAIALSSAGKGKKKKKKRGKKV